MPQRVRNHVLESLSRDALSLLLTGPLGWVVRDIAIDYGIDVEVEIFESNGNATGLTFKVQLKGMEKPDHIGPYRDIDVEHLKYWSRLDVPVLLVAYDDSADKVYGRWIHSLDLALKPNQKSKRIRFTSDDEIVAGDPRLRQTVEIVRRLKSGQFGRPFPVRFDGERAKGAIHDFFEVIRAVDSVTTSALIVQTSLSPSLYRRRGARRAPGRRRLIIAPPSRRRQRGWATSRLPADTRRPAVATQQVR